MTAAIPKIDELGRTHLIGVGGAGMSAIAGLLAARGVPVSGSDAKDSAVLGPLRAAGGVGDARGHGAEPRRGLDLGLDPLVLRPRPGDTPAVRT